MEFGETLSFIHLQQHLLNPDLYSYHHNQSEKFHYNSSDHHYNPQQYQSMTKGHNHQEYYNSNNLNDCQDLSACANTTTGNHHPMVPLSLMATYQANGYYSGEEQVTPWDSVTELSTAASVSATHTIMDDLPLRLPMWGIAILITGYLIVFIFGVIGNCCILFVVSRLRRMKTVTNYFIFSLATADLFVLLFCLLPNLVSNIFVPWVLGSFLCKAVPYIQGFSVCSSIYFLVAIAVERCVAIQWPFKHEITKEKAKLIIAGIWLWSFIVALPWLLFFEAGEFDPDNPHLKFCIEVWPEGYAIWSTYYFLVGNLFFCYIFPLGVILACYLTIWFRVYRRPVPSNCYHKAMELIHQRSKTAVMKMLIVVVLIFALSWLPLYIITIWVKFTETLTDTESLVISMVYPVAQWLGCFNSCINPVIYSFLNLKFRKAFLSIVRRERKKNKIKFKHKSPTVNILLKRLSTIQYRVETTLSNNDESSESI